MAKARVHMGVDGSELKDITGMHKSDRGYYQGLGQLHKTADVFSEAYDKPAKLLNRHDHPVTLAYDGEAIILPPRGSVVVCHSEKLGALPRGVFLIPAPELTGMKGSDDLVGDAKKAAQKPAQSAPKPGAPLASPAANGNDKKPA